MNLIKHKLEMDFLFSVDVLSGLYALIIVTMLIIFHTMGNAHEWTFFFLSLFFSPLDEVHPL